MSGRARNERSRAKQRQQRQRLDGRRQARASWVADRQPSRNDRFWHGGAAGLGPGEILVGRTEAASLGRDLHRYGFGGTYRTDVTSSERVYFSSNREVARAHAALTRVTDPDTGIIFERGSVYEVEPVGPVERDPDYLGNVSWCAPRARVVAVVETNVPLTVYGASQRLAPYVAWKDGSPVYDEQGRYRPSPEQLAGMDSTKLAAMSASLCPWTPVEFVNAWMIGRPSGDRPDPARIPNITHAAAEGGLVASRHRERATALVEQGVIFTSDKPAHRAGINRLLPAAGNTVLDEHDERGVLAAVHPRDGVVGALVFEAMTIRGEVAMFVQAISVAPTWRHRGLGSVLLQTGQHLLPGLPAFVAGHGDPQVAPFFAQLGFTVLRPGIPLIMPLDEDPAALDVGADDSWFYRQGPV